MQLTKIFPSNRFPLILLLLILNLSLGCGKVVKGPEPTVPEANAGEDQIVFVDYQCQLDGSLSTGNLAVYLWRVKSLPSGAPSPIITSSDAPKAYFTPTSLGTYEFELELSNVLGVSTDEVKITIVPFYAPTIETGFYGICSHLQSHDGATDEDLDRNAQMISEIGAQFVRFDFDWKDIEPEDDKFSYAKYENIIAKLDQKNLKVLGILDYGNTWSDPTTGNVKEINRFADFALNTVKHFKEDVKFWQIWNEPNNETFWANPSAENYTKLVKAAYAAIKQADPDAVAILGGLVGNGRDEVYLYGRLFAKANFLPDIYSNEGKDYFDVASIHPYNFATDINSTTSIETAINDAETIMANNGDSGKELWVTELGPLYFPHEPNFLTTEVYTETQVANWLKLIYTDLKTKCSKLFWYEFRDYPGEFSIFNLEPNWEGLVKSDYTTKEAYAAYKNLSK